MKQGNVYGDSVGAATPIELAAENRVSELETEILLELEGDREHKWFVYQDLRNVNISEAGQC
jgi:hypothetical protein